MRLEEYLDEYGIPMTAFAKKIGVCAATVNSILKSPRDGRLSISLKIEDVTKGQVTCRELISPALAKKLNLKKTGNEHYDNKNHRRGKVKNEP